MKIHTDKLGSVLLKLRIKKGFSQTCLATRLGISQKAYSNIETGLTKLDFIRFLKITEITETSPMFFIEQIIDGSPAWETSLSKEQKLLQDIEKLEAHISFLKSENNFLKEMYKRILEMKKQQSPTD
jgi:transcriptional regulator with XRE-family HTH domain